MSAARSALGLAGVCAVSFGGAFAAGRMTRDDDRAKAVPAVTAHTPAPARASIADLAPAAELPGLRVTVTHKRSATRRQSNAASAGAVAARPVRVVAPAPAPVVRRSPAPTASPPAAKPTKPAAKPSKPAPKPSKPAVAFFDDGS